MAAFRYAFTLDGLAATPLYGPDLAKIFYMEAGQRFFRSRLSGVLTFTGKDYDYIASQPFDKRFEVVLQYDDGTGGGFAEYWRGEFYKTDCRFDADNKLIRANTNPADQYTDVLAGLGAEFNLVETAAEKKDVFLFKNAVLQIVETGADVCTNLQAKRAWEQPFTATTGDDLENLYGFDRVGGLSVFTLSRTVAASPGASGAYVFWNGFWRGANNSYLIREVVDNPGGGGLEYNYQLLDGVTLAVLFDTGTSPNPVQPGDALTFSAAGGGASGSLSSQYAEPEFYGRYLTGAEKFNGVETDFIPVDDPGGQTGFKRSAPYGGSNIVRATADVSETATGYGTAPQGGFYKEPSPGGEESFYPLARGSWGSYSVWAGMENADWEAFAAGDLKILQRDFYTVGAVIKAYLAEHAPGVAHEETSDYSEFLYNVLNPVTNDLSYTYAITQKSNVVSGQYDQPAQRAPIKAEDLLMMLKNVLGLYWFVDAQNRFRIEHISWFKNGGSYVDAPGTNINLLNRAEPKTGKAWAFNTNSWEYEKTNLPERLEFQWMDKSTQFFDGVPVSVVSGIAQKGQTETVAAGRFSTDISYLLSGSSEISLEGFALAAVFKDNQFTAANAALGFELDAGGGLQPDANFNTTDFLPVAGGKVYDIQGAHRVAWYDATEATITSETLLGNPATRTAPQNAVYLRIAAGTGLWGLVTLFSDTLTVIDAANALSGGVKLQNGVLSWPYLQEKLLNYDLPARSVNINGADVQAAGVREAQKQNVSWPSLQDPDPLKLVETGLGSGKVGELSVNLCSRMVSAKLKYEHE